MSSSDCLDKSNSSDSFESPAKNPFFATVPYQIDNPNVLVLYPNNLIKYLISVLRSRSTERAQFKFCADRLIRLVVEQGLNQLQYVDRTVTTPTGYQYEGKVPVRGHCGVSILPAGEAMEKGL